MNKTVIYRRIKDGRKFLDDSNDDDDVEVENVDKMLEKRKLLNNAFLFNTT